MVNKKRSSSLERILFYVSLSYPVIFFIIVLVLDFITPHFNPVRQTISMLVLTINGVYQTANFIIGGLLMAMLGLLTLKMVSQSRIKHIIGGVILLFGVAMLILAVAPSDKTLIPTTSHGEIHFWLFVFVLIALLISVFVTGIMMLKSKLSYARYCFISFALALLSTLLILDLQNYAGVFERIVILTAVVWFTVSPLMVKSLRN